MAVIKLEKISGHEKKGVVGKIEVVIGQSIKKDAILLNIESSKGNVKIKSPYAGIVESISVEEGSTVQVGDALLVLSGSESQASVSGKAIPDAGGAKKEAAAKTAYSFGIAKPKKEVLSCDLAIIGGGPGGYVAAIRAAQLGANVVLVEKSRLGGTCLNHGCIPTKALVKSAHLFKEIQHAAEFGIQCGSPVPDMAKIIERKDMVVDNLVGGIEHLMNHWHVRVIHGEAQLLPTDASDESDQAGHVVGAAMSIKVSDSKQDIQIHPKDLILATGAVPIRLPIPGADLPGVITSEEALHLQEIPERMIIIGGGVIGMEFAFIYSQLGAKVTVVEFAPRILSVLDEDVSECLLESCMTEGIQVVTSAKAEAILQTNDGQLILEYEANGNRQFVVGSHILMAVGRKANLDNLPLNALGVSLNERHNGVKVDSAMRTSAPHIYAIGDMTNMIQLAHVASHQGVVAVETILGKDAAMSYQAIPSAVFTTPEIGTVGICEKQLQAEGRPYRVGKFPFVANGKAQTQGETAGFVKLLTDEADCIIGASIVGPGATDMIAGFAQLITSGVKGQTLAHTVFAHPTTAEAIHEAALALNGEALHYV